MVISVTVTKYLNHTVLRKHISPLSYAGRAAMETGQKQTLMHC